LFRRPIIQSSISSDAVEVTPKRNNNHERVSALQSIKDQLKERLDDERQKQLDAVTELENLGDAHPNTSNLSDEVTNRGSTIMVLSQKLTRTQHALGTLERANSEFEVSAQKVRDVRSRKTSVGLSHTEARSIRQELDMATSMMSAACQRVEQIESITDTLINQLSETEDELADLQNLRNSDLVKIEKLAHERDCLAMQLAASDSSSTELREKQDELNRKLDEAKTTAKQFAAELDLAGKAMEAREAALAKERDGLKKSLAETLSSQSALKDEIKRKEADLEDANRRAAEGTPKGKGAKEVLPLALKKLKGTQDQLLSVSEEKDRAIKDLEYAKQLAQAREDTYMSQALEKDEALQNVMKSAAAAAHDAATKQEAINKLRIEIAEISEAKVELESNMEEVQSRVDALAREVALKEAQVNEAKASADELKRQHNTAQAAALEKEIVLKTHLEEQTALVVAAQEKSSGLEKEYAALLAAKHELQKSEAANAEAMAALTSDIASRELRASQLQDTVEKMQADGVAANEDLAKTQRDLHEAMEQIKALNFDLAKLQASKNEVSGMLQTKEADIVALTKDYAAKTNELKATVKVRDEKIAVLEQESAAKERLLDNLSAEMEKLTSDHANAEASSTEALAALASDLNTSRVALADLRALHAALEEQSQSQLERAQKELDTLKCHLVESGRARSALESSLADEKRARSVETCRLTEQVDALERSKESLLRSLEGLEEQLAVKDDEVRVAQLQGTPKGEAAKQILQRTLIKVKHLQSTIKDQDIEIAALRAENAKIPALLMETAKLQSEVEDLADQAAAKTADLAASKAHVTRLEQELLAAADKLESEKTSSNVARSDMASKIDALTAEVDALEADRARVEQELAENVDSVTTLRASLEESRNVLACLTNKEEGTTKVMKLSFVKVKKLEKDLLLQQEKTATFSAKLKEANDVQSATQRKLDAALELHNGAVAAHAEASKALEANVARLRCELLDEVAKVEALEADLGIARAENEILRGDKAMLQNTIDAMAITVDSLESRLSQERDALLCVEAAKDSIVADLSERISEMTNEKQIAETAWGQAAVESANLAEELNVARSQLAAFERSTNAKESTIVIQKRKIYELERRATKLQADADNSKKALSQREAELEDMSRGKLLVEKELAENIEVRGSTHIRNDRR
jgi:chromosome segregation ATPase